MRALPFFRPIAPLVLIGAVMILVPDPRELARRAGARVHLSIATGGTGGVWYPYGGGIARIITRDVPGTDATAEVTAASVDNLRFLAAGSADLAFTMSDALQDAHRGTGPFAASGRVPVRAMATLYTNFVHVVGRRDAGIASIRDLRGRRVSTGAPGSGTEAIAIRMLEAAGLSADRDLRRHALGAAQSVDAFRDGRIDAFFWAGGIPTAAILDLMTTSRGDATFIPAGDVLPRLQAIWGGVYERHVIPAGSYPGLQHAVPVVGVATILVAHERLAEQLAWEITRALFARRRELVRVHPEAHHLEPRAAVERLPVPLHAGAARYYRGLGVLP